MDRENIWKWLEQVQTSPINDQGTSVYHGKKEKTNPLTETGQARVFSPDSPFARFNRDVAFVGTSFRPQIPASPDAQHPKQVNVYKRRHRKKTKESRYEYKGQSQKQPNPANNRRKQVRNHTLNESFRASNVVSQRLTGCSILPSQEHI